ncbi:holo-ACP synthase [Litorimonas sp. RW-G-Af-16]|uniref:holo-ACP synthase n=1 Tax=Litorimonas sp. RW-G-Af-16 TaxID=3241168 RepID=UPI00390CA578
MIIGIGTDICDIRRIEKSIEKFGQKFLDKTFTPDEQAYCEAKARPAMSYAKRFAAKEAVAKALATDTSGALGWTDVSVKNVPSGRPIVLIKGTAQVRLDAITPTDHKATIHISLSDDYPYATAFAVVETLSDC